MRIVLIVVAVVIGVLAFLANFTPWWFYPGTDHWELRTERWPSTACVPSGDTLRIQGRRASAGPSYRSTDLVAGALGRFKFSVLTPEDSFWVSKRGSRMGDEPKGTGTVDRDGRFTGVSEGLVAVEMREGPHRRFVVLTVLPPLTLEVVPDQPSVQPVKYVDLEVRATFADGTSPPAHPAPRLRQDSSYGGARVQNQVVSSRGQTYAPWHALVHVSRPGTHLLTLTYMTRSVPVRILSNGGSSPEPSEALVDSVKRALFPLPEFTELDSLPDRLRWRMQRILRSCNA